MADDKTNIGAADRRQVADKEGYEVDYFARKHRISAAQARDLIDRHGNDRAALDVAAGELAAR